MVVQAINSAAEFKTAINGDKPAIIDFWATWCGPCRAISPILEKISDLDQDINFYKVDVDVNQEISIEQGIRAMPTFLLFKNGERAGEVVGANPAKINELVSKAKVKAAEPLEAPESLDSRVADESKVADDSKVAGDSKVADDSKVAGDSRVPDDSSRAA